MALKVLEQKRGQVWRMRLRLSPPGSIVRICLFDGFIDRFQRIEKLLMTHAAYIMAAPR